LQEAPLAPTPRRNPFVFGAAVRMAEPVAIDSNKTHEPAPQAALDMSPVAAAPIMPLTLSGIGVTNTADGVVRTAVLVDGAAVHLLRVGQAAGGYTVTAITDDTVTLADASGVATTLRLR
jgi:hypothetical protein